MRKLTRAFAPIVFVLSLLFSGCALPMLSSSMVSMDELPAYSDSAYVEIDGNQPSFTDADKQETCLLYTSPSPRDYAASRMPSSA